jgi:glycosyltransferase involved in cell wall biosynthesis
MINNLAQGFLDAGYGVDFVLARTTSHYMHAIPDGVRKILLGTRHTYSSLPGLTAYLKRENPAALLAVKDRAIKVAVMARWFSGLRIPVVGRLGTTVSAALEDRSTLRRWAWYKGMRLFYGKVNRIVAVSQGVARDIIAITGLPAERITVVRNPAITPQLYLNARAPLDHPWFSGRKIPVIMGVGRLTEQKDFKTLIRAFAILRTRQHCRLVILGEGRQRPELVDLASDLAVEEDVSLPGFVHNPYCYLSRSSLFVLSSRWEGSPNVLTESLALGIPVVSTDCRSGPREILQEGKYGPLVTPGDPDALAEAMGMTLDNPLPENILREAASEYTFEQSVSGYLKAMGINGHQPPK